MASKFEPVEMPQSHPRESRVSSSDDIAAHEKISPVPSYDDQRKDTGAVETKAVQYGTGIEEKDMGESQSSVTGENEEEQKERSTASKIWHKYKPVFHGLFLALMT